MKLINEYNCKKAEWTACFIQTQSNRHTATELINNRITKFTSLT